MRPSRLHPWRLWVVLLGCIAVLCMFSWSLFDVQVVRASKINSEAQAAQAITKTVFGPRGSISDSEGKLLADTVMMYHIVISPRDAEVIERQVDDPNKPGGKISVAETVAESSEKLAKVLGLQASDIEKIIQTGKAANPVSQFSYVKKLVDRTVLDQVNALKIDWVFSEEQLARRYPNGAVAGNLVGFTDSDGNGIAGLENSENQCLQGENGEVSYLRSGADYVKIPGTEVVNKEAQPGKNLKLTIDSDLQWAVQRIATAQVEATGAQWATVTVMDAKNGKLLAVADVPTVDPNNPTASAAEERGSRAFTSPFEPGSTFKAITASLLIDAGKAEPNGQVVAGYRFKKPGVDVNDSERHGDLHLTLTGVLIESSNTGISQFGERIDDQTRYKYLERFGLGTKTEIGFPGEADGDLHGNPADWDPQTKYATMFGQGLTTTAVQMVSAYQTIANHGLRMPVQLVEQCGDEATPVAKGDQVISATAADQTTAMLEQVYRFGWLAKTWKIPGYRVAAKTGTAQVADGKGGYQKGYLVSVEGYAPAENPRFIVSVNIMNPVKLNSSAAAAPVFRDVMLQALKQYRVLPSTAPSPDLPATW